MRANQWPSHGNRAHIWISQWMDHSLYAIVGRVSPSWFLIELRCLSTSLSLLVLAGCWLLAEFANHHVVLSKDCVAWWNYLSFLELDHFLLVALWIIILPGRVRSHWNPVLWNWLHTIIPDVGWSGCVCRLLITLGDTSLLSLDSIGQSSGTGPYLAWSVLLTATCSYGRLPWLVLVHFCEWTHWSLALWVCRVVRQQAIEVLWSCTWSWVLLTHTLDFTFLIW